MKVTWVKGNLSSGKPVELDTVVEYMKDAAKAKPVKNMREMIPYCSPGSRAADAEKVPVILFASGYKEQEWKCYNGLVLLEFDRLANISEARRLCDEVAMYNQPLLAFVGSSGLSVKVVVRCRMVRFRLTGRWQPAFMHMLTAGRCYIIRHSCNGRRSIRNRRSTGDAASRMTRNAFIIRTRCRSGWSSRWQCLKNRGMWRR